MRANNIQRGENFLAVDFVARHSSLCSMLADDILALLKKSPMTSEELATELHRTENDVLLVLHGGELKGLVEIEFGGKWKRIPTGSV